MVLIYDQLAEFQNEITTCQSALEQKNEKESSHGSIKNDLTKTPEPTSENVCVTISNCHFRFSDECLDEISSSNNQIGSKTSVLKKDNESTHSLITKKREYQSLIMTF